MLGGIVLITSTICVAFTVLPEASFAVHNTVVFPSGKVFDALFVIVTGSISDAVALPSGTVLLLSEVAWTFKSFDSINLGGVVWITLTICVAFALFPASSVAIHN